MATVSGGSVSAAVYNCVLPFIQPFLLALNVHRSRKKKKKKKKWNDLPLHGFQIPFSSPRPPIPLPGAQAK
jgi:hypothetical protein